VALQTTLPPLIEGLSAGEITVFSASVTGDASCVMVRGKLRPGFDVELELEWILPGKEPAESAPESAVEAAVEPEPPSEPAVSEGSSEDDDADAGASANASVNSLGLSSLRWLRSYTPCSSFYLAPQR
jgi:hypothetical protein